MKFREKKSLFKRDSIDFCTKEDRRFFVEMPDSLDSGASVRLFEKPYPTNGIERELVLRAETTVEKWRCAAAAVDWLFGQAGTALYSGFGFRHGVPDGACIGRTSFWLGEVFGRELLVLFCALGPALPDEAATAAEGWATWYRVDERQWMSVRIMAARGERLETIGMVLFGMFTFSPRLQLDGGR